jgi:cyclopropane fatty-acyl-phospholipid synthase-like methyltransferase
MTANESTLDTIPTTANDLPVPHRCPWWVQYWLISPLRRLVEPAAKLVGPYVEPGMTVLDVGCGFGYVSLPLAHMVGLEGRVLCVDVEPRAIARLERRAQRAGLAERIQARPCNPRDLGLADFAGQVDLVTVIHTLHELEDLPGFLAQVRTLLTANGRLLVVEPRGHVTKEQFAAMMDCCRQAGFEQLDPPEVGNKRLAALLAVCAAS